MRSIIKISVLYLFISCANSSSIKPPVLDTTSEQSVTASLELMKEGLSEDKLTALASVMSLKAMSSIKMDPEKMMARALTGDTTGFAKEQADITSMHIMLQDFNGMTVDQILKTSKK